MQEIIWWLLPLVTYFTFVVQTTLAGACDVGGVGPNLIVAAFLLLIPRLTGRRALVVAATWGILSDAIAPAGFGIELACFSMAAFIHWHLQKTVADRAPALRFVLPLPASFVLMGASWTLRELLAGSNVAWIELWIQMALAAAYTGGAAAALELLGAVIRKIMVSRPAAFAVRNRWRMLTE